ICDASPRPGGGAWSRQGVILFAPDIDGRLFRVAAAGGIAQPDTWQRVSPAFLPDGNHYVFQALGLTNSGVYLGEIKDQLSERPLLIKQNSFDMTAVQYGTGHLLFVRNRTLVAQPFDTRSLKLSGDAFPLAQGFGMGGPGTPAFAVSDNGVLAFRAEG